MGFPDGHELELNCRIKVPEQDGDSDEIEFNEKIFAKLLRSVEELDLCVRSRRRLKALGTHYIGDLVRIKKSRLRKVRGLGRNSIAEIEEKLTTMGLHLGMNISYWPPTDIGNALKAYAGKVEEERKLEATALYEASGAQVETLDGEIDQLLALEKNLRKRQIVAKYFGFDGKDKRTLELVGQEFSLTRERIRRLK